MKIAFFSRNRSFAGPLLQELTQHHTVRIWNHNSEESINQASIQNLLNWCDLAYLEWLQPPNMEISQIQGVDKPLVAFCHGIDAMNHYFMEWRNISGLIVQDALWPRFKMLRDSWPLQHPENPRLADLPKNLLIQSIGVDTNYYTPLNHSPSYNIVMHASSIRATKRIYTGIQQFDDLIHFDEKTPWHLTVVGDWYDEWEINQRREYLEACEELLQILHLSEKRLTVIDKNLPRDEWRHLLQYTDIFWCTSWRESFGSSLAEAAACGVYPLVNHYLGAEQIYPGDFLCKTPGEFVEKTFKWGKLDDILKSAEGTRVRQLIKKYDSQVAAGKIRLFLEEVKEGYKR
jgi:hypothetical protein